MKNFGQYNLSIDRDANKHAESIGKGKAILLEAWTGPGDARRLKILDIKTFRT